MNGLDLFSGIGGIGIALKQFGVRTVAYCERDRYAQGVLLSRMRSGDIDRAPIWDDVRTLSYKHFRISIDIIYGGFPCQDISVAGAGKGLEGERSGLFFEIVRLVKEIQPSFIFLENVPAIRTRGLDRVCFELASLGYDIRWTTLSAASVGANHKRDRSFLLGYSKHNGRATPSIAGSDGKNDKEKQTWTIKTCEPSGAGEYRDVSRDVSDPDSHYLRTKQEQTRREGATEFRNNGEKQLVADPDCVWKLPEQGEHDWSCNGGQELADTLREGLQGQWEKPIEFYKEQRNTCDKSWWEIEPDVGRVVNELPYRVDRIRCLGNSVVPLQVQAAFKKLIGEI